jgi:hypothetical protein
MTQGHLLPLCKQSPVLCYGQQIPSAHVHDYPLIMTGSLIWGKLYWVSSMGVSASLMVQADSVGARSNRTGTLEVLVYGTCT